MFKNRDAKHVTFCCWHCCEVKSAYYLKQLIKYATCFEGGRIKGGDKFHWYMGVEQSEENSLEGRNNSTTLNS